MGMIVHTMEVFAIWFEECPCKIPMNYGLGVGKS
jgi:hypothetical protein